MPMGKSLRGVSRKEQVSMNILKNLKKNQVDMEKEQRR